MSTRSQIGIKYKDGRISSVYCHCDGYPEYNGVILNTHYKRLESVKMIQILGGLSSLNEKLQDSVFYKTWRDEEENAKEFNNIDKFEEYLKGTDCEYSYLFDENTDKWIFSQIPWNWVANNEGLFNWQDLNDYIIAENLLEHWETT